MSTTIGNLAVILSANAAGFATGMAAAQKSATSFMGTMASMAKSAGAIVGIASAANLASKAFEGFTRSEESLLTFQSLLGSASQAKAFKEELKDFGDMTPFGDGVGLAAKELLKFNFAQEEVLPTLRKLGDVAAGVNVPLEEMAAVVGKSGYRASISGKQLIALTEMGVPIMQELTKTMGVSQSAITQLAEQGAIKFEHLMAAFDSASGAGGNFFGMMEARANTTKNLMARIVDQTGDVIAKLGSVLGNRISSMFGVKSFGAALFDWLQRVEEGVKKMGPWFENVILGFQTVGDVVGAAWIGVTNTFQIGWDVISGGLSSLGLSVAGFQKAFTEAATAVRFVFNNFADVAASIFGRVGLMVYSFGADVVHTFTTKLPEALKWFANNWQTMWDNIISYAEFKLASFNKGWGVYWSQTKLGVAALLDLVAPGEKIFENALASHEDEKKRINAIVIQQPLFKDLPALALSKRLVSDDEKRFAAGLDAIDNRLANAKANLLGGAGAKQGTFLSDFVLDLVKGGTKSPGFGDMGQTAKAISPHSAGAFDRGSKEAYNVLWRSRYGDSGVAGRTAKATEGTHEQTKKSTKLLEEVVASLTDGATLGLANLNSWGG